ncbi:uncharacterized protein [Macrobrachium rosenbergii]
MKLSLGMKVFPVAVYTYLFGFSYGKGDNSIINEENEFCSFDSKHASCDFKHAQEDTVYLTSLGQSIQEIDIQNTKHLSLSEDICAKMMVLDIGEVSILRKEHTPCDERLEFSSRNSSFSRIPEQFKNFYLRNCSVASFSTDARLSRAIVATSTIRFLEISEPLSHNATVEFINTTIKTIQRVTANEGSVFRMTNSAVGDISLFGLIASGGSIIMNNSSVGKGTKSSFIMQANASLVLEKFSGNLNIVAFVQETSNQNLIASVILNIILFLAVVILLCIVLSKRNRQSKTYKKVPQDMGELIPQNDIGLHNSSGTPSNQEDGRPVPVPEKNNSQTIRNSPGILPKKEIEPADPVGSGHVRSLSDYFDAKSRNKE